MKKNIHPKYKNLKVRIRVDIFETMSTYHKDEILMDIDFRTHPAWTKKGVASSSGANENINAFNQKFSGLSFMKVGVKPTT